MGGHPSGQFEAVRLPWSHWQWSRPHRRYLGGPKKRFRKLKLQIKRKIDFKTASTTWHIGVVDAKNYRKKLLVKL